MQNRINFGLLAAFGDAQNWHPWRSSNYSRLAGQNEPLLQQLQVGAPKHLPFQHFESIILPFNGAIANLQCHPGFDRVIILLQPFGKTVERFD
jgi:hypothetical protein